MQTFALGLRMAVLIFGQRERAGERSHPVPGHYGPIRGLNITLHLLQAHVAPDCRDLRCSTAGFCQRQQESALSNPSWDTPARLNGLPCRNWKKTRGRHLGRHAGRMPHAMVGPSRASKSRLHAWLGADCRKTAGKLVGQRYRFICSTKWSAAVVGQPARWTPWGRRLGATDIHGSIRPATWAGRHAPSPSRTQSPHGIHGNEEPQWRALVQGALLQFRFYRGLKGLWPGSRV